ncbi:FecR family protein [Paracoccus xiamenensis]|uniref:FecR family protein n=1 Tax=Paracoccus xiamenensis TaxID=2714901 RepID=UPI00140DBD03|nr:FecR domain-containing protein [Paracoccus xiamenensis]NHF74456.1 iron dicitrate transport regulator FecR [Paracoccus xiamenensis]
MTSEMTDEDQLYHEAFDLLMHLRGDPGNQVLHDRADKWRALGPAHQRVWSRAAGIDFMSRQIVRARHPQPVEKRRLSRRSVFLGGAAATLAAASAAIALPPLLLRARADHLTASGEMQNLRLADGSTVTLGPDSAIRTKFGDTSRQVELLKGMAYFDVAPDAAKPFRVSAGPVSISVLGTSFDLSMDAGIVSLAVDHGVVEAVSRDMNDPQRLMAGDWISVEEGTGEINRGKRDTSLVASWRHGTLLVENETVAAVVDRIARWQRAHVVIADPALGSRRVSGVYNLDQPESALKAVIAPYGGNLRRLSPWALIISRR